MFWMLMVLTPLSILLPQGEFAVLNARNYALLMVSNLTCTPMCTHDMSKMLLPFPRPGPEPNHSNSPRWWSRKRQTISVWSLWTNNNSQVRTSIGRRFTDIMKMGKGCSPSGFNPSKWPSLPRITSATTNNSKLELTTLILQTLLRWLERW